MHNQVVSILLIAFGSTLVNSSFIWNNLTKSGVWGGVFRCGGPAKGFVLIPTGRSKDDRAHFKDAFLICTSTNVSVSNNFVCPNNAFLNGFRLRLASKIRRDQDQDLYNIQMKCSDGYVLNGDGYSLGRWLSWKHCPKNEYIDGFSLKNNHKTGLNNVKFQCSGDLSFKVSSVSPAKTTESTDQHSVKPTAAQTTTQSPTEQSTQATTRITSLSTTQSSTQQPSQVTTQSSANTIASVCKNASNPACCNIMTLNPMAWNNCSVDSDCGDGLFCTSPNSSNWFNYSNRTQPFCVCQDYRNLGQRCSTASDCSTDFNSDVMSCEQWCWVKQGAYCGNSGLNFSSTYFGQMFPNDAFECVNRNCVDNICALPPSLFSSG